MSRLDNEIRVTPSIVDRLIDLEPRQSQEPPKSRSTSLRELKQAVRRDLEWLLNTRCFTEEGDGRLEELKKSVAYYGLPDFTGVSAKNHLEQKRMTKAIESTLKIFEPRFIDLKVTLARLNIEPTPEPVTFDTILQLGSGDFAVVEK